MQDRQQHQQEVRAFLQRRFKNKSWKFTLPQGTGHETYFVHSREHACFVKLGVDPARYQAMASIGLTPKVLEVGSLQDGKAVIVQPYIKGKNPSRRDYQTYLDRFAIVIRTVHHSSEVKMVLPKAPSDLYRSTGLESLVHIQSRWNRNKSQVPELSDFIDESLDALGQQVKTFQGDGLVASHNDICNANWLITPEGQLYLIDLESMSLDDPAVDIGALLWWYYPPKLRHRFLIIVDQANDKMFTLRMRVRMAMHCLSIILPREQGFEKFDAASFPESLIDFKAILACKENPQGYAD